MAAETKEDICEMLRKLFVFCMKRGENLVLYLKKSVVDFKEQFDDEEKFPVNLIFDHEKWFEKENYMKIVNEEENEDHEGNKGCYEMREDKFQFIILHDYSDIWTLGKLLEGIPNHDEFTKLMVADDEEAMAAFKATQAS